MNISAKNLTTQIITMIALGAITTLASSQSAHAFSLRMTSGIAGPNGETNQGAFSEFYDLAGTTTIDFNDGQLPSGNDVFASYSFSNGNPQSSVRADMWAPTYANLGAGESNVLTANRNDSNYLAIFEGNDVIIDLQEDLNYFGINWGAAHQGNTYSFYKGESLLQAFTTQDIEDAGGFQHYNTAHPGGGLGAQEGAQGNGYAHFYSDGADELFDRIVISQVGGGGFETDNHSFHVGRDRFTGFDPEGGDSTDIPEPGMLLSLAVLAGGTLMKRKRSEQV